jgi:hypothetical protein
MKTVHHVKHLPYSSALPREETGWGGRDVVNPACQEREQKGLVQEGDSMLLETRDLGSRAAGVP